MAASHTDLFSSIISEIKAYAGTDPLLPWIRGVRKMRDSLPRELLGEKMPRFLQKCAQTFESDRRYRNDLRFIRVWLELMDYVDDPKAILRTMEKKRIGIKRSLFYQAYALYYEKMKKFDEADSIYRVGVKNLAEPLGDLEKSYEKFLQRMEHHKSKIIQRQEKRSSRRPLSDKSSFDTKAAFSSPEGSASEATSNDSDASSSDQINESAHTDKVKQSEPRTLQRGDTVIIKFVDTAIVRESEAEDACHHGLVEPTINMKEAMNDINDMFREPLEPAVTTRGQPKSRVEPSHKPNSRLEVFIDDSSESRVRPSKINQPVQETFQIFADDEADSSAEKSPSCSNEGGFPFLRPDQHSESSNDAKMERTSKTKFREDTVVHRFVGSTILDDDAEVENICHHGLVDPTVNLKQAMDDINGMFGKPIDFVRMTRKKKLAATAAFSILPDDNLGGFSILPDDDMVSKQGENQNPDPLKDLGGFCILRDDDMQSSSSGNDDRGQDLHEQTVFTKMAMDDINKMFAMPLDF